MSARSNWGPNEGYRSMSFGRVQPASAIVRSGRYEAILVEARIEARTGEGGVLLMHRCAVVVVCSLVVALVPVSSSAGADRMPDVPHLGVVLTDDALERSPTAAERVVAALRAAETNDLEDALSELAGEEPVSEGFEGHAGVFLQGDATGDGLSETLVVQITGGREEPALLVRMMTPPGHVLWEETIQGQFVDWTADVDLDGDGATDLLWRTATAAGSVTTWRIFGMRGSDGSLMWERTILAASAGHSAGAGGYDVVAGAGRAVIPILGPDADGDGGADVWLSEVDLGGAAAGESGTFNPTSAGVAVNRFSLLSGATGTEVSTAIFPAPGSAFALPVGDLSGDGQADILATQIVFAGPIEDRSVRSSTVTALDSSTGAPLWSVMYPGVGAIGIAASDLTGDGLADVLVPQSGSPGSLAAVSGADGRLLWEISDPLFGVVVPGNIDGAAGDDVLFLDAELTSSPRGMVVHGLAVRGEDGAVLYETFPFSVELPSGGFVSIGFAPEAGDMDGDGTLDSVLSASSGLIGTKGSGAIHLLRASDGRVLWEHPGSNILGGGAGDLDGDGLDDVLRYRTDAANEMWEFAALSGQTGDLRWTRSFDGAALVRARVGEPLGGPADDVLFGVTTEFEDPGVPLGISSVIASTRVDAVDGADGSLLWSGPAPIPL